MNSTLKNRYFKDRDDASLQLIDNIDIKSFDKSNTVFVGISEGGAYIADKLANKIGCMMDILLSEPIYAPNNEETIIAMISETQEVVMNKVLIDAFDINEDFVYEIAQRKYDDEVISYVYRYRQGEDLVSLENKDVILVDECVESGLTMLVSIKSAIARGARNVYIATPILDKSVYHNLLIVCDGVFCPHIIEHYISVEYYFEQFPPIEFKDIVKMIDFYANKRYNDTIQ